VSPWGIHTCPLSGIAGLGQGVQIVQQVPLRNPFKIKETGGKNHVYINFISVLQTIANVV
jgi:hypothetical protein